MTAATPGAGKGPKDSGAGCVADNSHTFAICTARDAKPTESRWPRIVRSKRRDVHVPAHLGQGGRRGGRRLRHGLREDFASQTQREQAQQGATHDDLLASAVRRDRTA